MQTLFSVERNFECARQALRIEYQVGSTELTAECTLYEVRAEALLLWRTDLRAAALLPNEFHSVSLTLPFPQQC